MITTGAAPAASSPGAKSRPRNGCTLSTENVLAVTATPLARSAGCSGSLMFICWNRNAVSAGNDRALSRQSSNSCHDAAELSSSSLVVSWVAR